MEEMLEKEAAPAEKPTKKRTKKKAAPAETVQPDTAAAEEKAAESTPAAPAAGEEQTEKPRRRLPRPVYHTVYHVEQALYADRDAERPILRRVDEGNLRFDLFRCAVIGAAVLGASAVCAALLFRHNE